MRHPSREKVKPVYHRLSTIAACILRIFLNLFNLFRCGVPAERRHFLHFRSWAEEGSRALDGVKKYSVLSSGDLVIHHTSSYDEYKRFVCSLLNVATGTLFCCPHSCLNSPNFALFYHKKTSLFKIETIISYIFTYL